MLHISADAAENLQLAWCPALSQLHLHTALVLLSEAKLP